MPKELERPTRFEEVREFLGVGPDFLYKALQEGRITGRKLGNRWIIYESDLKKYLDHLPNNQKRIKR